MFKLGAALRSSDFHHPRATRLPLHRSRGQNRSIGTRMSVYPVAEYHLTKMPKDVKRKRVVLSLKQKLDICKRLDKGETRRSLSVEYNVGLTTIHDIKKQSKKLQEFYVKSSSEKGIEKRHTLQLVDEF